jgi:NADPH-dependent ferric siderophore reductase
MARINPGTMQTDSTNFIDANEVLLGRTLAQLEKSKANLAKLESEQAAANVAAGLNPDGTKKTNTQLLQEKQAKEKADREALAASNPLFNKAVKPTDAPAGMYYAWIGGTNTGQWQLYKAPVTTDATTIVNQTPPIVSTAAVSNITDPAVLALINSLNSQIASLSAANKSAVDLAAAEKKAAAETTRKNAIDVLTERFQRYGLGSLVNKIKELAVDGATEATITLGLQETQEYKTRFKANEARIKKGLQVLNPGEYLNIEDGYRQVLRAYGLKQFDTDDYVSQFIANDVSAAELSNRVVTAVQRVQNADPAISQQLRDFYGIGQADLVAYVLDPNQQFQKIERQVAASEIGVAAARQGLKTGVSVAEQLAAQGVTQAEAQKGYATIADILPTAEKLSDIYGTTLDSYGQTEAEQEVFNSLASAQRKRQKLTQREIASFSGAAGTNKTSLTTSVVGQF